MAWDTQIKLLTPTSTTNDIGDTVRTRVPRPIFVNKKSIRQSEFWQAQETDLKPEIMFEAWLADYQDEQFLLYQAVNDDTERQYTIIRTYEKNNDRVELICGRVVSKVAE